MTSRLLSTSVAVAVVLGLAWSAPAQDQTEPVTTQPKGKSTEPAKKPQATKSKEAAKPKYERATFGAGCFWHVEAVFERLPGVESAVSGYSGGDPRFRSYDLVHEGWTGHAEVVQVTYDPEIITYKDLLKVFWSNHDPTTLNRQGEDEGTQYRSVIFYHNKEQREAAFRILSVSHSGPRLSRSDRDPAPADEGVLSRGTGTPGFLRRKTAHARAGRSKTTLKKATKSQTKAQSSPPTPKPTVAANPEPSAENPN